MNERGYRLKDPGVYETWYEHVHTDPTRLTTAVYGLPEIYADKIPSAELVANPGCYTSTSILALAPLLAAKVIDPTGIIIRREERHQRGRADTEAVELFSECNESVTAYSIGKHAIRRRSKGAGRCRRQRCAGRVSIHT